MKNSDIALIILIAVMSIGISYWVMGMVMGNPSDRVEEINYLPDILSIVDDPDSETFNAYAKNLNEEIFSGECKDGEVWNNEVKDCVSPDEMPGGNTGTETETEATNPEENQDNEGGEEESPIDEGF